MFARNTHAHTYISMHACAPMMTSPPVSDKHRVIERERECVLLYHIGGAH